MAYPTTLDDLTTAIPTGGSTDHEEQHTSEATAIEALQAKVGIGAAAQAPAGNLGVLFSGDGGESTWVGIKDVLGYIDDMAQTVTGIMRKATVTLSSADILALHTTPITAVAAPGAGKWINVHRASGYYNFGTVDYVVTVVPRMAYDGQTAGLVQVGAIDYGQDSIYSVAVSLDDFATVYVNKAVVVMCDGSAITTGDGTLTVTVWYTVEDVPA